VNIDKECPFWATEYICKNPDSCTVSECEQIPNCWKNTDPVKQAYVDFFPKKNDFLSSLSTSLN
jgi:hypothetical protein